MAKVQIKSEKITSFGGIFHVREFFFEEPRKTLFGVEAKCVFVIQELPCSHSRCEGIRSPLVADSVSTVTKLNTLEI